MDFPYFEKPIFDKEKDVFGFDSDAKSKADAILNLPLHETYTIAVYGEWGSGKTSYVNLILNYIQEARNNFGEKIVVVKFDTSLFQNSNDLISEFYKQIFSALKKDKKLKKQRDIKNILTTFSEYAYFVCSTLEPISKIELPAKIGASIFSFFSKKNLKESTLGEKRQELESKLLKSKYRFIIVIDDIDRLQRKQAKSVFKLIYTISRLPNHTFILPMDKDIVAKNIHKVYGIDGVGYLEKIVQLEVNVPLITKNQLKNLLFERIQDLFYEDYSYDEAYKDDAYEYCISQIVNTPRDVYRLVSHFIFRYNTMKDYVNPIDYLIIAALNLYFPKLYSLIKANRYDLCERNPLRGSSEFSPEKDREHKKNNHNKLVEIFNKFGIEEKYYSLAESVLGFLFPEAIYNFGINFSSIGYPKTSHGQFICDKDFFDGYFAFEHSIPNLSKSEIKSILETDDEMKISKKIIDSLEDNTFDQFIDSIDKTNAELSQERINVISSALFLTYDSLCIKNEYKHYDGKYFTPNVLKELCKLFNSFFQAPYNKDKDLPLFLKKEIVSPAFSKTYLAISNVLIIQHEYLNVDSTFASIKSEEKLINLVNLYFSKLFSLPAESIRLFNDLCDSTFKLFLYYYEIAKTNEDDSSFQENMEAMNNLLVNKENLFKCVKQLRNSWVNCDTSDLAEFREKKYPELTELENAIPVIKSKLSELEKETKEEDDDFAPLMNPDIEICRAFLDKFDKKR